MLGKTGEGLLRITIAALCMVAVATTALAQATMPTISRTVLNRADVPGSNYEAITARVEIPAGFKPGRHFHNGLVQVTVLEGSFWLALDGQPERTLAAGESVSVPLNAIHNEGAAGDAPVKLLATFIVEKGKPLAEMVK